MADVLADVTEIIARQLNMPSERVHFDSRLETLGVESLDIIEIIFALEKKYDIAIPFNANDSAMVAFDTVGEVADAVRKLV